MSGQLKYSFHTPVGVAGGIFDISPYRIDSFTNESDDNELKFGGAVMRGSELGKVAAIASGSTAKDFLGVAVNGYTNEMDMSGRIQLKAQATVGVMRWGVIWGRVPEGLEPEAGDELYVDEDGLFTNDNSGLAVAGRFTGQLGTGNTAVVEIYNQSNS